MASLYPTSEFIHAEWCWRQFLIEGAKRRDRRSSCFQLDGTDLRSRYVKTAHSRCCAEARLACLRKVACRVPRDPPRIPLDLIPFEIHQPSEEFQGLQHCDASTEGETVR